MTRLPLHTIVTGEGPPTVILHGLFGSARNWGAIARRLASSGRRVIAADLRNHGDSPHDSRMDHASMAEDVAGVIEEWGGGRAAVLGHSTGGKVALALALSRPALVERLIVVDIAPVAYRATFGAYASALRSLPLRPGVRRAEADALLAETVRDAAGRGFLQQNLVFDDGALRWKPNLAAIEANMPLIGSFPECLSHARSDGPVLVVRGERSGYVRPDHHDTTLALFSRAMFVTVPGAGHWVQAEAPEAFPRGRTVPLA